MPSPFPGMDPYIESHSWSNFHFQFISALANTIEPLLRPRYAVCVEEMIYLSTTLGDDDQWFRPDVLLAQRDDWLENHDGVIATVAEPQVLTIPETEPVTEHYIVLRPVRNAEAATVIELLSPTNKASTSGRAEYLAKRRKLLRCDVNLVEIDLLRSGRRLPTVEPLPQADYFAFIARATERPKVNVYSWKLADRLPSILLPLAEGDPDLAVDLQAVFELAYDRAGYSYTLDYTQPVEPQLSDEQQALVKASLAAAGR